MSGLTAIDKGAPPTCLAAVGRGVGVDVEAMVDTRADSASIFAAPFASLDDAALLAHYRAPRSVRYYPVADAHETQPAKIEALLHGRFEFNHETHRLDEPIDWLTNPSRDVEWHILLHKFYYAVGLGLAFERSGDARYVQCWVALVDGWIARTPPGFIAADVTGRRVQNWIYSHHLFVTHAVHDAGAHIDPAFHARLLRSIHTQTEYLCANLTPKRNHRTIELYAIFLAGVVFPEMRRAAHWRAFALAETVANIAADLLPDGVHCELSTDYHHLVLKNHLNLRRLAALNGIAVPPEMDAALQRALDFSLHVHQPAGNVPSLSDGDARGFLDLLQQGADLFGRSDLRFVATAGAEGTPPQARVAHFTASGYSIVRSDWGGGRARFADAQHLVFDAGPLGEGNHGHFDCLSFELAAFGRPLVVDPGRYTYSEAVDPADGINWRVHFRGTAAHNTVCVDGLQQTRYLPRPIKEASRHAEGSVRHKISGPAPDARLAECFHAARLDLLHGQVRSHEYDAVHERCIVFIDRGYWIVSDWLRAPTPHRYTLKFQLGRAAQGATRLSTHHGVRVESPGLLLLAPAREAQSAQLESAWVSTHYGQKHAAPALCTTATACDADFTTVLLPWKERTPVVALDDVVVDAPGAPGAPMPAAQRVALIVDGAPVTDHWFHARGAAADVFCIGGFEFTGRWVHWRESADGRVLHAVSHRGAELRDRRSAASVPVVLEPETRA